MPRSLTVPSRLYEPGVYGPYSLDSFTNANTEYLVLRMKWENWPQIDNICEGQISWSDGTIGGFSIPGYRPKMIVSGQPVYGDYWSARLGVRKVGNGKASISGATAQFNVLVAFTTTIEFYSE